MKIIKMTYDKILTSVLEEQGFENFYQFNGYGGSYMAHKIIKVVKDAKKILGIPIPFTQSRDVVADISSEAKQAESQHDTPGLKYDGLEIRVRDKKYEENVRLVCEKLEKELSEPVTLVTS